MKSQVLHTVWCNISGQAATEIVQLSLWQIADIDECADPAANNCGENAACSNTEGSFSCACNAGYTGDGVTCTGEG